MTGQILRLSHRFECLRLGQIESVLLDYSTASNPFRAIIWLSGKYVQNFHLKATSYHIEILYRCRKSVTFYSTDQLANFYLAIQESCQEMNYR